MKKSFSHTILVIGLMVLGITGCDIIEKLKGDYSKSSGPPVLPDLQLVQPNIDFFTTEFTDQSLEDTSGYELASLLVNSDFDPFVQSIIEYMAFLEGVNQTEPEARNDGWEWHYNYTHQSKRYDIQVTSKQVEDTNVRDTWTLFITSSERDEPIENYKLMELTTQKDRSGGYWIIYPPEIQDPSANFPPYLSLFWESYNLNNSEYYYEFDPYTPDSNEGIQAGYIKDDNSNFKFNRSIHMFMENTEFEVIHFNIGWNNNTKEGSISFSHDIEPGMGGSEINKTICWDVNLNNIECQF